MQIDQRCEEASGHSFFKAMSQLTVPVNTQTQFWRIVPRPRISAMTTELPRYKADQLLNFLAGSYFDIGRSALDVERLLLDVCRVVPGRLLNQASPTTIRNG